MVRRQAAPRKARLNQTQSTEGLWECEAHLSDLPTERLQCCCWVQELKDYLRQGIQLDELWRVARGEIKLRDFEASTNNGNGATAAQAPQQTIPDIPQDLVRNVPSNTMPIAQLHSRPGRACGVTPYIL